MSIRIKDIPVNDRPRERLISRGVESLSSEELLAILLKTGTIDSSAKVVATNILKNIGNITYLKDITLEQLKKINGIGEAKACVILASIELGNRIHREVGHLHRLKINSTELVFKYYKDLIGNEKQEYFYCLYLDHSKHIIKDQLLFIGTMNYSVVHPREIFKEAFLLSASAIICVHNHPSGNVLPSKEDLTLTNRLIQIGHFMGIPVIDHVIISNHQYYSFYENNDMKE